MNWQAAVEKTVTGLGYELVDCERSAAGLLRVYIDKLSEELAAGAFITVDDCEKVTRQLQYVLEVENAPYERLEVSSPGVDRPLKKLADYQRFAGEEVQITLRVAFQGRKKYKGQLQAEGEGWRLVFNDGKADQALDFSLDEVREAKLVPALTFKGRNAQPKELHGAGETVTEAKKPKAPKKRSNAKARQSVETVGEDEKVDGGPDQ